MISVNNYELFVDQKDLLNNQGEEEAKVKNKNFDESELELMILNIHQTKVFFLDSIALNGLLVNVKRVTLFDTINSDGDNKIKLLDINPALSFRFLKESKGKEVTKIYLLIPQIKGMFSKESMDFIVTAFVNQILAGINANK